MTGPEHYLEAERLLADGHGTSLAGGVLSKDPTARLQAAQVHATLALAAATAVVADDETAWRMAIEGSTA